MAKVQPLVFPCRFKFKKLMKYFIIFVILILSPWTYTIFSHPLPQFDKTLWQNRPEEIFLLNQRRGFYPFYGKFFQNKLSLLVTKLKRNLFYNLDPNLYFFATHPRERLGIRETEKFPVIFLPFFLIGFFVFLKKTSKKILTFTLFALFLSAFLSPQPPGPIFMYPVIIYLINLGIQPVFKKLWPRS